MKAFFQSQYGGPEVLKLIEQERPVPGPHEVLVQNKAVSVNPMDWHMMRASPVFVRLSTGMFKPKHGVIGADFSGIVIEKGSAVSGIQVGDEVFGESHNGSFAEFNTVGIDKLAIKPSNVSFEEMACVGVAGLTALQGLRDHAKVQQGQKLLINGASGGVGHLAVQIAHSMGAEVWGVCSAKNVDFVKAQGASHVIDYNQTSVHQFDAETFDAVLDVHGNMNFQDFQRLTQKGGVAVKIGFVGMGHMMKVMLGGAFSSTKVNTFTAKAVKKDLQALSELVATGKLLPKVEKTFSFEQLPDAIGFIEHMHTQGKVAVSV